MPGQSPEGQQPSPDDHRAAGGESARPRFAWVPGSELPGIGPVHGEVCDADLVDAVGPDGLDYRVLLDALAAGGLLDGREEDQDAVQTDELEAEADGRVGPPDLGWAAGLAVEHMDPGPAQAAWLEVATDAAGRLDENCLAGMAIAARKLTARAQASGLAAVAQLAARAAAADPKIGLAAGGRPSQVCRDAVGQVSLALALTDYGAAAWADLAVTLAWRLPGTGAALAAGVIDLARARVIAEATSVLSEQAARQVEEKILPGAGEQTTARLRARLRAAVIAADPAAADRRRQDAERRAKVSLYADADGVATLAGTSLPAVAAAAAMTRITAIAKARKAAGQDGGLDLHRAQVMLGLLLGSLPYIPPPGNTPEPPPPAPDDDPPPSRPSHPGPGDPGRGDPGPGDPPGGGPWDDLPVPPDEDAPADDDPGGHPGSDPGMGGGWRWDGSVGDAEDLDLGRDRADPAPAWPALGVIPPALTRPPGTGPWDGRPVPGLLDVTLPWAVLAGRSAAPGLLGRIGPITAIQALQLARAAGADPAAQWRVIVTNAAGQALAVTRIRRPARRRARPGPGPGPGPAPGQRPPPGTGLVGRVTITITQDTVTQDTVARQAAGGPGGCGPLFPIAAAALRAAARALARARLQARADQAVGGCAHAGQSPAYRPPPRLRERVTARDVTCRFVTCRQPAWRADLDHTVPWDDNHGGRTCSCNLGGGCRKHHQLKQHPRWKLDQPRPGHFTWTTPAGRTYTAEPDSYPA